MIRAAIFIWAIFCSLSLLAKDYMIADFGAVPDAEQLSTASIQAAIDSCGNQGGGRVVVERGRYTTGTLFMRSRVELHLAHGARIVASTDTTKHINLFGKNLLKKGLIHAENVSNIAITGFGTIDGSGKEPVFLIGGTDPGRTYALFLKGCRNVTVKDVTLTNPSFWTFRIYDCETVFVRGIHIYSHSNLNNDGIDIDGRDIVVSDCIIDATDDGICLKSENPLSPCENIAITNCVVASNCNAIKFGTPGQGGFRNIAISNCVIKTPSENDLFGYGAYMIPGITARRTNNSGISMECVDGGVMEKITIDNIVMENVNTPLFIRFGRRNKTPRYTKDIIISNIIANSTSLMTSSITGLDGSPAENIAVSNVIFNIEGGGLIDDVQRIVPEAERSYPENRSFGSSLPAYGFFLRHVKDISLSNIRFNVCFADHRPAVWIEDGQQVRIDKVTSNKHDTQQPYILCRDVRGLLISGFTSAVSVPLFMRAEKVACSDLKLLYNDFSAVSKIFETATGVTSDCITSEFNLIKKSK